MKRNNIKVIFLEGFIGSSEEKDEWKRGPLWGVPLLVLNCQKL